MNQSRALGIKLPPDFPQDSHDLLNDRIAEVAITPDHWIQCGPALNAVAYRFLGCARADDVLRESFEHEGATPPPDDRAEQELAMFQFVVSAESALESLAYALFAAGWINDPERFPLDSEGARRAVSIKTTAAAFAGSHLGDNLTAVLASKDYVELDRWRNALIHRSAPGRLVRRTGASGDEVLPTVWQVAAHDGPDDVEIGPGLSRTKRAWVVSALTEVIGSALRHFEPPNA